MTKFIFKGAFISLLLLVLSAGLLMASGQKEAAATGPVTLNHWTFIDPAGDNVRSKAHAYVQKTFMEKNPNIQIKVNVVGWQQLDPMLVRAAASGEVPDTSMIYHPSLSMHVNAGSIQPLDPYVKDWNDAKKNDFVAPWSATVIGGKKWGFHYDHRVTGMMYRQDLLDQAGIAFPKDLGEMAETAKKLHNPPNMVGILSGVNSKNPMTVIEWAMPIAYSEGGILLAEDGKTKVDSPAWAKTLDYWKKLVHEYKVLPQDLALAHSDEAQSVFISGKGVFHIQSSHRLGFSRDKSGLGDKIQYRAIPSFKAGKTSPLAIFGWILVMPKGAKNPDAAIKFIDHFISPEMQAHLAENATYTPVRKSALDFPWFKTEAAKDVRNFMEMAAANPLQPLVIPEQSNELLTGVGKAWESVIMSPGQVTPEQALKQAADDYNSKYAK